MPATNAGAGGELNVGDSVYKVGGGYRFEGVVVAKFQKLSGQIRYVVENREGLLFISSNYNLEPKGTGHAD